MRMELPDRNTDYRELSYWDSRYSKEEVFDWFTDYDAFKHLLRQDLKDTDRILILGCGNSLMSEKMYQDGFHNIINTDYSEVVIDNMRNKCGDLYPGMDWETMDMLNITYKPESFDVVIEKGTLDALVVHERDPWNMSEESCKVIETALSQINTVLKPNGTFISISFAQPHFRRPHYAQEKYSWSVRQELFGDSFHYFYYVMCKGQSLSDKDKLKEQEAIKKREEMENEKLKPITYLEEDDNDEFLMFMNC